MEIYHSKIRKGGSKNQSDNINPSALSPLLAYRWHLGESWPEIKDKIEIGFVEGTNGTEICFSHNLGWENKDWLSFVENGIALPIALENCKKYGIKKFVFFCNNEIMEVKPEEL
jgi:hypothetical protein